MDILKEVYYQLEDENFHSLNFMLNWMYDLFPNSRYYGDCIRLQDIVKDKVYEVKVRSDVAGSWTTKKFKMVIKFEEVK
jgi:hypothetical protein